MPGLSQIFNKLNNYNYTDQYVDMIKNYLRNERVKNSKLKKIIFFYNFTCCMAYLFVQHFSFCWFSCF